ncbi:FISUMP domain-containing protein [Hallerella succinigenes]|uniref:FISUMP domain-containing protein n=1 Tax=Hallerella succinigenes TaxID=1896222 RepID=UPI000C230E82|nr:FISUMP domain-containing protein [Hallerella succinigenes]
MGVFTLGAPRLTPRAFTTMTPKGCGYAATCEMADTVHGICPKGYHLPNTDEFKTLQNITVTLGPYSGQKLKAETDDWQDVKTIYGTYVHTYGTDNYGFGALPTYAPGSRYAAIFWTFSQSSSDPTSHGSALDYAFKIIGYEWPDMSPVELELEYKDTYFSIRCIQDAH